MKRASLSLRLGLTVTLMGATLVLLLATLAVFALDHELDSRARKDLARKMQQVEHNLRVDLRSDDLGEVWTQVQSPVPVSFSASAPGGQDTLWLANQAGGLFSFKAGQLHPKRQAPLPPTAGLLALDGDRLLALTVRGAIIVPLTGERP